MSVRLSVRLSHTVAEKCDCRRKRRDNGDSLTFLRQCGKSDIAPENLCRPQYFCMGPSTGEGDIVSDIQAVVHKNGRSICVSVSTKVNERFYSASA